MEAEDTASGLSRRDLIKRSAVAGGLVWATPMVLARPASAEHCPSGSCPVYYTVKITPNLTGEEGATGNDGKWGPFDCSNLRIDGAMQCTFTPPTGAVLGNPPIGTSEQNSNPCAALAAAVLSFDDPGATDPSEGDGGELTLTLKSGYSFIFAATKKGSTCPGDGQVLHPTSNCREVFFPEGASHIEFAFCAPS